MTKLANAREAHFSAEVPADYCQASRTAIHLVDLQDMIDFPDTLAAFAKQTTLIRERLFFALDLARRLLTIQLHFVVHLRFRRKQFGCEIERNTRFRFCLIESEPLAQ